MGQVGVAGRLFDDLEQIGLTAVAFLKHHVLSQTFRSIVASKQPKPQKKTMHLFINLLLVTVGPQPLWWEELGSVTGICAFLFELV